METIHLTRKELYDLVWNEPMVSIAKRYKISDTGLRKICKRFEIPTPANGYWSKKKFGKKITVEPFIQNYKGSETISLTPNQINGGIQLDSPLKIKQSEIESNLGLKLKVPKKLHNPDPLILKFKENLVHRKKYHGGYFWKYDEHLSIDVEGNQLNRAILIMDTFIKAINHRGHEMKITTRGTFIIIVEEELKIQIREKRKRVEVSKKTFWDTYEYKLTGILIFKLDTYNGKEWKDGRQPLEAQLSKIIASLELESARIKLEREQIRKSQEEYERQKQIEIEIKQRKLLELNNFKELLNDANRWKQLSILRDYIDFMESKANLTSQEMKVWLKWARDKADWYDPSVNLNDELMVDIDKNTLKSVEKN